MGNENSGRMAGGALHFVACPKDQEGTPNAGTPVNAGP